MGENSNLFSRFRRLKLLANVTFRTWNDTSIELLESIRGIMTQESEKAFDFFKNARDKTIIPRIFGFWKAGISWQKFYENVFLEDIKDDDTCFWRVWLYWF